MTEVNKEIHSSIRKSLLKVGMVAEDLVKQSESDEDNKTRLVDIYKRQNTQTAFTKIGDCAYSKDNIISFLEELELSNIQVSKTLCKITPLSIINEQLQSFGYSEFDTLKSEQQKELLWHYGFDTKYPYEVQSLLCRSGIGSSPNAIVEGLCVVGSERTDREWIKSPQASYEAKIYSTDHSLANELRRIS